MVLAQHDSENELNSHETHLMSLFWRTWGSTSSEQHYCSKSEQCWPTHQSNGCQENSEWFQILEVIWGNVWCNESRKINRSSVLERRQTWFAIVVSWVYHRRTRLKDWNRFYRKQISPHQGLKHNSSYCKTCTDTLLAFAQQLTP